ncbi:hypothetical protein BY996DRAFT_2086895 [Phakopsora pachyrhizi]|nr:hypothetical protein BY996DRAFT_2086895 [Phakopsora pachyrhizi]
MSSYGLQPTGIERTRTSSSPNMAFIPNSFSSRPSVDSCENSTTICPITGSPRRGKVPPPIKVPKLKGGIAAVAVGGEASPNQDIHRLAVGHRATGSESILTDRRFAGIDWPIPASRSANAIKSSENCNSETSLWPKAPTEPDSFEDLASPSPRSIHISYCSPNKLATDRLPGLQPLQPPPRKLPHLHSFNQESKNKPLPLLISKHSRSLGRRASRFSPSPSPTPSNGSAGTTATPTSADAAQILPVSIRASTINHAAGHQIPKRFSFYSGVSFPMEPDKAAHFTSILPFPGSYPKPESENLLNSSLDLAQLPEPGSPMGALLVPHNHSPDRTSLSFNGLAKSERHSDGSFTTSYDLSNLPQCFVKSQESCLNLPAIAIPQTVSIPQLTAKVSPMSSNIVDYPTESTKTLSLTLESRPSQYSAKDFLPDENILRKVRSDISSTSSSMTNMCFHRASTPSSSCDSQILAHSPLKAIVNLQELKKISFPSANRSRDRSSSAGDFKISINSLLSNEPSFQQKNMKHYNRPRSMSDRGPLRIEITSDIPNQLKPPKGFELDTSHHLKEYPSPLLPFFSGPASNREILETRSIEEQARTLNLRTMNEAIKEALEFYPIESQRFLVGGVANLKTEIQEYECKVRDHHVRYLADLTKREKLLQRHITTLRAFNGDEGARFGESLAKAISNSDYLTSQLLSMADYTSRLKRLCEGHWRAAAIIQMRELSFKANQLESYRSQVEKLKVEQRQNLSKIADLEAKIKAISPQSVECGLPSLPSASQHAPVQKRSREGIFSRPAGFVFPSSPAAPSSSSSWSPAHMSSNSLQSGLGKTRSQAGAVVVPEPPSVLGKRCEEGENPAHLPVRQSNDILDLYADGNIKSSNSMTHSAKNNGRAVDPLFPFFPYSHIRVKSFESDAECQTRQLGIPRQAEASFSNIKAFAPWTSKRPNFINPFATSTPHINRDILSIKNNGKQLGLPPRGIITANLSNKDTDSISPNTHNGTVSSTPVDALDIIPCLNRPNDFSILEIKAPPQNDSSQKSNHIISAQGQACPAWQNRHEVGGTVATETSRELHRDSLLSSTSSSGISSTGKLSPITACSSRRRPRWVGEGGNLSSITLSQLGSIDIASLLTDLEDEYDSTTGN